MSKSKPAKGVVTDSGESAGALDLEPQISFYASYHTNPVNVAIHLFCIPLIFATATVLINKMSGSPVFYQSDLDLLPYPVKITPGFLFAAAYGTYFVLLDPIAGGLYTPFTFGVAYFSSLWLNDLGIGPNAFKYALFGHLFGWTSQFIGHAAFEGRAPALFDSLLQALVLAVFFVWLELLFALGYKPDLHKRIKNRVGKAVLEYRRSRKAKGHQPAQGAFAVTRQI